MKRAKRILALALAVVMTCTLLVVPALAGVYEFGLSYDDGPAKVETPRLRLREYVEDFAKAQYFKVTYEVADETGPWVNEGGSISPRYNYLLYPERRVNYAKNINNRPDDVLSSDEWKTVSTYAQKCANRFDITFTFKLVPEETYDEGKDVESATIEVVISPSEDYKPEPTPEPTPTPMPMPSPKPTPTPAPTPASQPTITVDNKAMSVKHDTVTVTINGQPVELEAVVLTEPNGGAHTYFKLRDVGQSVGFNVDWNAETGITVDSAKP